MNNKDAIIRNHFVSIVTNSHPPVNINKRLESESPPHLPVENTAPETAPSNSPSLAEFAFAMEKEEGDYFIPDGDGKGRGR